MFYCFEYLVCDAKTLNSDTPVKFYPDYPDRIGAAYEIPGIDFALH